MALVRGDVVELKIRGETEQPVVSHPSTDEWPTIPRPLLELYNRASLFLDKQSSVHDHYWAVGIHKAIHKAFPECGEIETVQANAGKRWNGRPAKSPRKQPGRELDYSYRTRTHQQHCQEPSRCSAATILNDDKFSLKRTRNEVAQIPKRIVAAASDILAHAADNSLSTVMERCAGKRNRGRRADPEQLALEFASQDQASSPTPDTQRPEAQFRHRFERPLSMEVGQTVVLICSIWSPRNRMTIERGTWGKIAEVGTAIKVKWKLPYFRKRLWDRFRPDEFLDYFEEE
jgi:hypothetical protein